MRKSSQQTRTKKQPLEIKLMVMLARGFKNKTALDDVRLEVDRMNIHDQCRVRLFLTTLDNMMNAAAFQWATLPDVARPEDLPKLAGEPPLRAACAAD